MKRKDDDSRPESLRRFRYWVEVKNLGDAGVRRLPLSMRVEIKIPTKKSPAEEPRRETLVAADGESSVEAPNFDQLVVRLRDKYPDGAYERTLHIERDLESERAWDALLRVFAEAAAHELLREAEA